MGSPFDLGSCRRHPPDPKEGFPDTRARYGCGEHSTLEDRRERLALVGAILPALIAKQPEPTRGTVRQAEKIAAYAVKLADLETESPF